MTEESLSILKSYLSEEEIKGILESELRNQAKNLLRNHDEVQSVIGNSAYNAVWGMCDEVFDGDAKELLNSKVKGIIETMTSFNVFKAPNAWDKETNNMYDYLQSELISQKPRISEIISERVEESTLEYIKTGIEYIVSDSIQDLYKEAGSE